MTEAQRAEFFAIRRLLDSFINKIADVPAEINESMVAIRPWKEGVYAVDDVRMYEGVPYKCVLAHDSTGNETWNPTVDSLWAQYHGTSPETAREFKAEGHNPYQIGHYCIFNGQLWRSVMANNVYSPVDYSYGWELIE